MRGFKVGDHIIENANNPAWGKVLDTFIRWGEIIDFRHIPGCPQNELHPFVRWEDGSQSFAIWDCLSVDTQAPALTPIWKDESKEALEEVVKALSSSGDSWNPDNFGEGADPNEPPDPDDLLEKAKWQVNDYIKGSLSSGSVLEVRDDGILVKWTNGYKTSTRKNKKPVNRTLDTFYDWDAVKEWKLIPWRIQKEIEDTYAPGTLVFINYDRGDMPSYTGVVIANDCYPFIDVKQHGSSSDSSRVHFSKLRRLRDGIYDEISTALCWLESPFEDCSIHVGDRVRVAHAVFTDPCLKQNGTVKGFLTYGTHLQISVVVECDNGHSTTVFVNWLVPLLVNGGNEAKTWQIGDRVKTFHHSKREWLKGEIRQVRSGEVNVVWDHDPNKTQSWCAGYWYSEAQIEQEITKGSNEAIAPASKTECSSSTNSLAELADSAKQPKSPEASPSETMLTSMPTPKPSTDTITPALTSTVTLEPITPNPEPMSTQSDSPAQAQAVLVLEPDLITPNPVYGLKPCDALSRGVQTLWLLKTLKILSIQGFERCLGDSEWQDIRGTIRRSYRQHGLALSTAEIDSSSLPTPTSYSEGSGTHRPAGQNKLERTLKLLPTPMARDGKGRTGTPNESLAEPIQEYLMGKDKMHPAVPCWMMGFPPGYTEDLLMDGGKQTPLLNTQASPIGHQGAAPVSNSTVARSCRSKRRSRLKGSSTLPDFLTWDEYQKRRGK